MQKEEKPLGKKKLLEKVLSGAILTFFSAQSIFYGSRFIWKTLKMWEWEEVERSIQAGENSFLRAEKWRPMKRKAGEGSHFPFHHPTDENWVTGYSLHSDGITPRGLCIQIMRQMGLDTAGAEEDLLGNDL